MDLSGLEPFLYQPDLNIDYVADIIYGKRLEINYIINPVQELRPEGLPQRLHRLLLPFLFPQ